MAYWFRTLGVGASILGAGVFALAETSVAADEDANSPPEKLRYAEQTVTQLEGQNEHLQELVQGANQGNDVMQLNCLNPVPLQFNVVLETAIEARDNIASGIRLENLDLVEFEFNRSVIARQQGVNLTQTADGCLTSAGPGLGSGSRVVVTGSRQTGDNAFGPTNQGATRAEDASPSD
jgi:hypothetical protein